MSDVTVAPDETAPTPGVFENVIVPLGTSTSDEVALGPASELTGLVGARLRLLSVGVEQGEADQMARHLATLARGFDATIETRVDFDVAGAILRVARENDPALICMASHGRGRLGYAVLGSHATGVIAGTTAPVLLVGPNLDPDRRLVGGSVVVCVDESVISLAALPSAAGWATLLGVPLEVVTVVPPDSDLRPDDPRGPSGDVHALAKEWRRPDLQVTARTIHRGDPPDAITSYARTTPAGLLVLTSHAGTGVRRIAFGSVASAVVHTSPVPVLAVPPLAS